jgi:hypothetical protein
VKFLPILMILMTYNTFASVVPIPSAEETRQNEKTVAVNQKWLAIQDVWISIKDSIDNAVKIQEDFAHVRVSILSVLSAEDISSIFVTKLKKLGYTVTTDTSHIAEVILIISW